MKHLLDMDEHLALKMEIVQTVNQLKLMMILVIKL